MNLQQFHILSDPRREVCIYQMLDKIAIPLLLMYQSAIKIPVKKTSHVSKFNKRKE